MPRRLPLGHFPTPLWRHDALDELVGAEVWIKRDDMTGGAEAGNKIRKLEYLLADAIDRQSTTVLTCGGVQSNHARATALLAAGLGLGSELFLRAEDPGSPGPTVGNLLLDRLAGARIHFITPDQYRDRWAVMQARARALLEQGRRPYVIPEGASNGLGALGYVDAMVEVRQQLDHGLGGGPESFDAVAIACGSGGSAAGIALGAGPSDVAAVTLAFAVCDDRGYFERTIARIAGETREAAPSIGELGPLEIHDEFKGPGYGIASREQLDFIARVARRTGLVLDPVYSGKALHGLASLATKPRRVLFIHTGGLPGLLAQSSALIQ